MRSDPRLRAFGPSPAALRVYSFARRKQQPFGVPADLAVKKRALFVRDEKSMFIFGYHRLGWMGLCVESRTREALRFDRDIPGGLDRSVERFF